ncbi:MAG TPA: Ig-like domain-containing protein, partial [Patescibacteria group bacterium]|nr:Ig-like domain-containing protein [Patescibacteria group bacterium]
PDAALHGIAVLAARVSEAVKVVFVVRAADGTEVMRRDAVKGDAAWSALWDTSRTANGRYAVEGLALDLSGSTTSSAHVAVMVKNGTGEPVSSIDVVPKETAIAAVRDVPSGSVALQLEKLPKDVAAAREKLSEECAAARIPAERCAQWLAMRHQSSDCRAAGIVTKEECVSFLEEKHGGAMPECAGGESACAEAVAKATAGLLGADELRGIRDAITPHIGQAFRIVPRGERPAAQEPGTPSAQPGGAGEPPQIIDDLIPLVSDRPFAVRVHASPGFGMAAGNLRHDSVPAVLFLDSDEDGLPDDVERRIGTDPMNKDTDGDGYDDGTELRGGYNPRGKGRLADGVKNLAPVDVAIASGALIEQPTNAGDVSPDLVVTAAETRSGLPADSAGAEAAPAGGGNALHLSGRAKPGQVVTIFIYSYLPVVLTTEANDDGTWSYDLDSGLSDGQHEVYATVTDETGKIQGKSNPLSFFVSEAKAVTEDQFFKPEEVSPLAAAAVQEPVRQLAGWYLGGAALLIVVALVIAYVLFMKPKKTVPPQP